MLFSTYYIPIGKAGIEMLWITILGLAVLAGLLWIIKKQKGENMTLDMTKPGYHKISPQQAKKIMEENPQAVVVDVRTQQEYAGKHIPGAVLIPHQEIQKRAAAELPDKETTLLLYCMSGARSKAAGQQLASMGYTQVYDFGSIMMYPYETVSGG